MPIIEPAIRPPSEANSFLLQITTGCSSNTCTFCGAYPIKKFQIKNLDEINSDIEIAARKTPLMRKVFLMDGDALAISNEKLLPILKKLRSSFPKLTRISSYANGYNLTKRTHEELIELKQNKLSLIYMGLESGSQAVLDNVNKKSSSTQMVEAVQKAKIANIKSSVIVLLGLGGKKLSSQHIKGTIQALGQMQPDTLSFLTLMLVPGTTLHQQAKEGSFNPLSQEEFLWESYEILRGLNLNRTIFRSNHASNYVPLEGRLPKDKNQLLQHLQESLQGQRPTRPEFMRGL